MRLEYQPDGGAMSDTARKLLREWVVRQVDAGRGASIGLIF